MQTAGMQKWSRGDSQTGERDRKCKDNEKKKDGRRVDI